MKKRIKYTLIAAVAGILMLIMVFAVLFKISNTAFAEKQRVVFVLQADPDSVVQALKQQGIIRNEMTFRFAAVLKSVKRFVPGRYLIASGESNQRLINKLRIGNQSPISIRLDGVQAVGQLPGLFAKYLRQDSAAFAAVLLHPDTIQNLGFTMETFPSFFIADTYSFFWTDDASDILKRMKSVYTAYWTDEKLARAKSLGLSRDEVATLASIVHGETGDHEDAKLVAGLYINRLREGIPLQADPTVLFAVSEFGRQRVLYNDLTIDSPYNTYQHQGLPPGPISLPVASFMDDVLNYTPSDYLYMCARPGAKGHNFTRNYEEHLRNAQAYRAWLDNQRIQR